MSFFLAHNHADEDIFRFTNALADAVRAKLALLGISEEDVAKAVKWARK